MLHICCIIHMLHKHGVVRMHLEIGGHTLSSYMWIQYVSIYIYIHRNWLDNDSRFTSLLLYIHRNWLDKYSRVCSIKYRRDTQDTLNLFKSWTNEWARQWFGSAVQKDMGHWASICMPRTRPCQRYRRAYRLPRVQCPSDGHRGRRKYNLIIFSTVLSVKMEYYGTIIYPLQNISILMMFVCPDSAFSLSLSVSFVCLSVCLFILSVWLSGCLWV